MLKIVLVNILNLKKYFHLKKKSTTEANNELLAKDHDSPTHEEQEINSEMMMPKEPEKDYPGFQEEASIVNQINEEEFTDQEVESIEVELMKDKKGLGITIGIIY